jgi:hypothetical protein
LKSSNVRKRSGTMQMLKHHLKWFFIVWNVTYIVMTAGLFESLTGYRMNNPIMANLVFAAILYPLWLWGRSLWRVRVMRGRTMREVSNRWRGSAGDWLKRAEEIGKEMVKP